LNVRLSGPIVWMRNIPVSRSPASCRKPKSGAERRLHAREDSDRCSASRTTSSPALRCTRRPARTRHGQRDRSPRRIDDLPRDLRLLVRDRQRADVSPPLQTWFQLFVRVCQPSSLA
jgi:hypothetical protein